MERIFILVGVIGVTIMVGTLIRNTEWAKEKHKEIHKWSCERSGGEQIETNSNWRFLCRYKVDQSGNIIRP